MLLTAAAVGLLAQPAWAQDAASSETATDVDEVVVTGIRATQRNSAQVKRDSSVIVDALVNDEIGALPDLSVGETLERVTGVAADRFKGSASEISVRGLGPFLGFSTFNGREVSSGSGDRAVSFQQFPSEIVNGVLVYKSQQADFVEGGVSGVIELRTLRPLDYGKRRFQAEVKGAYSPYDDRVEGRDGMGWRGSASFTDQFETAAGDIGVALGYARTDGAAAEDFYTASSDFRPCNTINTTPTAISGGTAGTNCSYSAASGNPVYFVANQYVFRQLETEDQRQAFVGALQWKPGESWDVNLDLQLSDRSSEEERHDLVIAEGRRGIRADEIAPNGALLQYRANSYLENVSTLRERAEDYVGGGLSVEYDKGPLTVSTDVSYSKTHRNQVDLSTRLRSNTLFGASGRVAYAFDQRGDVPIVTFVNPIDLNNHAAYTTNGYARRRMEDREDEIFAVRFDGEYRLDGGLVEAVKAGVRYSDHARVTDLDNNNDIDPVAAGLATAANANCRIPSFPQEGWMKESGTNVTSWATFDARCMYTTMAGVEDRGPLADPRSAGDIDVQEKTTAAYVMADFRSELGGKPVKGNAGVRFVHTEVTSSGFRGAYDVVDSGGIITLAPIAGSFDPVTIENDYLEVLPSVNLGVELTDDLVLRLAGYKAIARSNIEDMGAGREFVLDGGAATVEDAIAGVSGGNPRLEPLTSWNADVSLEWYPTRDTLLSAAVYYKKLQAGIVPAYAGALEESFLIDGGTYTVPVAQQTNSDESNDLYGFELTAQHGFTYLPGPLDGLGVSAAYNYADTDFEYEDPSAVDPLNPMRNFTAPVGIIGLSKHSGSASVYWEKYGASLRLAYKYRSDYFKPSGLTAIRTVEDAGFLDVSASYDLSKNVQVKFQALNVLDQQQVMYRPVEGSIAESSYFGPSYFFGVRFRY